MKSRILLSFAFLMFIQQGLATVRNVPSTYITIQSALNASVAGDTVLVQPGTYHENINWPSVNSIVLLSAGDSSNTIIDASAAGRVITFNTGAVDTATVIKGFRITNGRLFSTYSNGGGMFFNNSSPMIIECAITGNRIDSTAQWSYGAGIYCSYASPVFKKSSITANSTVSTSWAYGGGVHCTYNSNAAFYDCIISGNSIAGNGWAYGAGIYMTQSSSARLTNTIIRGNHSNDPSRCYGGGLYAESGSSPVLINVLIAGNVMEGNAIWYYGGGIYFAGSGTNPQLINVTVANNVRDNGSAITGSGIYSSSSSLVTVTNSILWNDNSGSEISVSSATVNVNYSCIRNGYAGTGNISNNPAFFSASDYHLQMSSPCINGGTLAGAPAYDLEGNPRPQPALSNPDMGCFEVDQIITQIELQNTLEVSVYPNPVVNELFITGYSQAEISFIEINDALGNRLVSLRASDANRTGTSIDFSTFPGGIYFCRIFSGDKSKTVKIIRQ